MSCRGLEVWRVDGDPAPLAHDNIIGYGSRLQIYGQCYNKRRIGGALPAIPSLGMAMAKILKDAFLLHTPHFCDCYLGVML